LTLIDSELFSNGQPTWEGGAEELQRELIKEGSACAREARQLLNWNGAAARYREDSGAVIRASRTALTKTPAGGRFTRRHRGHLKVRFQKYGRRPAFNLGHGTPWTPEKLFARPP
jgi:hypothetical protein